MIPAAKVPRSFPPVKNSITPPTFGRTDWSSARDLAAVAEAVIASALIPDTESPYDFIATPKGTNPSENLPRSLPPVKNSITPPTLGRVAWS